MDEFELELRSLTCISLYGDELENVFDDALTTKPNTTKLNIFQNSYKKCVLRPDRILQLTMVVILREFPIFLSDWSEHVCTGYMHSEVFKKMC